MFCDIDSDKIKGKIHQNSDKNFYSLWPPLSTKWLINPTQSFVSFHKQRISLGIRSRCQIVLQAWLMVSWLGRIVCDCSIKFQRVFTSATHRNGIADSHLASRIWSQNLYKSILSAQLEALCRTPHLVRRWGKVRTAIGKEVRLFLDWFQIPKHHRSPHPSI